MELQLITYDLHITYCLFCVPGPTSERVHVRMLSIRVVREEKV